MCRLSCSGAGEPGPTGPAAPAQPCAARTKHGRRPLPRGKMAAAQRLTSCACTWGSRASSSCAASGASGKVKGREEGAAVGRVWALTGLCWSFSVLLGPRVLQRLPGCLQCRQPRGPPECGVAVSWLPRALSGPGSTGRDAWNKPFSSTPGFRCSPPRTPARPHVQCTPGSGASPSCSWCRHSCRGCAGPGTWFDMVWHGCGWHPSCRGPWVSFAGVAEGYRCSRSPSPSRESSRSSCADQDPVPAATRE